ncbi:MAG: 3-oxoacid CoA-transferase [Proteobacteria bacterium]|nr:3-oxoacid CoA-transferase [Pseudomonadota bacterium]
MSAPYNMMEMMICASARLLEDGRTVAVGTGAPCAAAMLAQKTHAPNLMIAFEAGGLAPRLSRMPISVGDSRTFFQADYAAGMAEMMTTCARGMIDYAFLGGAQIDQYGNLNSTSVGDYNKPKVRFPGSGGANDFASLCWRTMIMTVHNRSRFVEKVEFLTSPGYLGGPGEREEAGLPPNTGPYKIITDLAILGYGEQSRRMRLESLHPGVSVDKVRENTGFALEIPEKVALTPEPTAEALRVLREQVDPQRLVIGK